MSAPIAQPRPHGSARTALTALLLAAGLTLSACGGDDSEPTAGQDAAPSEADDSSATPLSFELAEATVGDRFAAEKVCTTGVWSENSTGVDDEFAAEVGFFRQFDCYKNEGQVDVGFPERVQQIKYVEFATPETARAYAEDEAILYRTLLDDTRVVVLGTGVDAATMNAYGDDLQAACDCGEFLQP